MWWYKKWTCNEICAYWKIQWLFKDVDGSKCEGDNNIFFNLLKCGYYGYWMKKKIAIDKIVNITLWLLKLWVGQHSCG
jgi:hypothetical protein